MFAKIGSKYTLSQQVEGELLQSIRDGKFLPGEKLPSENALCEAFNVSRTAVREAMKLLSAKGILEIRKGSGAFVSEMNLKNTSEILNLFFELTHNDDMILETIGCRQLIEPAIASQAALIRTEKHLELLNKNMKSMELCKLEDKKKEAELDNQFHKILFSIAGNSVLELLFNPIFNLMPKFKSKVFAKPLEGDLFKEKTIMMNHHGAIIKAITAHNQKEAFNAMKVHLLDTKNNYLLLKNKK